MTDYTLEEKNSFTVLGFGTELAYVGGPNAMVKMGRPNGLVFG